MRLIFLIIILSFSTIAFSQSRSDPFIGGIEFSLGYGSIIDFNLDNNNFYKEYILAKLLYLPFQLGVLSTKYLNKNEYFEIGMMFTKRSSSFVYRYNYRTIDSYAFALAVLPLYNIDFPIKYYSYIGKMLNQQMYAFGGLIPSWHILPEVSSYERGIPENYFRDCYISVCGGLCYDTKKSRIKLHADLTVTSIVNSMYREIPQDDRDYGNKIFPFELLFSYAYMFK